MRKMQFNQLERKRRRDFFMICKTFQQNGVHTVEQALACKIKLLSNAKKQTLFVSVLGCFLSLVFEQYSSTALMGMVIAIMYIWTFTYRGRVFIQRYIDEILKHPDYKPETEHLEQQTLGTTGEPAITEPKKDASV